MAVRLLGTMRALDLTAKEPMTFKPKSSYNREEILGCSRGELFGEGNAKLPAPNMLMIDRIVEINNLRMMEQDLLIVDHELDLMDAPPIEEEEEEGLKEGEDEES